MEQIMEGKQVCPACGQDIKEKKRGLLVPTLMGVLTWISATLAFNRYYFAGSGFCDPMPLTHLVAGGMLGLFSGLIAGLIMRRE